MKKFLTLVMMAALLSLAAAVSAFADVSIPINRYQCLVCGKYFFGFEGDDLDSEELNDPDIQLKRVFQLGDRGKNLEPCNGNFKAHVFELVMTSLEPMSNIAKNMSKIAVVRDGKNLKNITITEWRCLFGIYGCGCKWPVYTLNDERLNIMDWDKQPDKLIAMKGDRRIPKCSEKGAYGHAFIPEGMLRPKPVTSYQIATVLYDLFYVKP